MPPPDLSLADARRIALAAQGFGTPRPKRADLRALRRVLGRLRVLQIDFVNVLLPAHYLVPFSRLGPYDRSRLDHLVYGRREFTEQWAHEASFVPVESWPLLEHRRAAHRVRPWGFETFLTKHSTYADRVLEAIRDRGPLSADELPEPDGSERRISDRWGWGLGVRKSVLEAHFGFGRLAVAGRQPNFARIYDLAERVIPPEHLDRTVSEADAQRELVRQAAVAHGLSTVADLADYFRMPVRAARARVTELVDTGELDRVSVEHWSEPGYLHPNASVPSRFEAAALLSPFDPVVWHRARAARVFGFTYRIEIFVPEAKRKWGYYVLPFLFGDTLVARVDLKADRRTRRLEVRAAYRERGTSERAVAAALAAELWALSDWLELDHIVVGRRGGFARALARAVRAR